jgi:hypothetical protein
MTKLINMTPHPINIVDNVGVNIMTIPSSGLVRLKAHTVDAGFRVDGVKITTTKFGEAEGLPDFKDGVFIIVSQLVKTAVQHRTDLLVPAEVLRDANGNIIGCMSLGI